jgi:glutamyl-tRNA reductase
MSPVSQALRLKFESVARAELQRMKKKTASMSEAERAQLEAISVHVVQALAAEFEQAIEQPGGDRLEGVVSKIFVLSDQPAA